MAITRRHAITAPLAALALSACGGRRQDADPNPPKILLRGNGPDPDSLDPHRARSTESMQPLRDLDQLYSFLASNGPIAFIDLPWIAVFLVVLFALHFTLGLTALLGVLFLAALTLTTNRATQAGTRELAHISARRLGFASAAIRFGGPSELIQERGRIEDASTSPFRPVAVHESDDPHVVDVREGCRRTVQQRHAIRPGPRRERLPFDPAPHGSRQLAHRQRRVVVSCVRVGE